MTSGNDLKVSVITSSLNVFPMNERRTVFQMELVIENPGPIDVIPIKTSIQVQSSFIWFSNPLEQFTITCEAPFWILRNKIFKEIFHFSLDHSFTGSEQHSFCEIINETKDFQKTLKLTLLTFQLSDATVISCPIGLINTKIS